jgi:predicted MFS family arabinose efflux permease
MAARTGPRELWQRPLFRRFWIGESISFLGNQVTDLALPLTAVLLLGATADQMGIMTAIWFLPYLVFGLPAGVWIDRMRRKPILVGLDLVAAAAVLVVPFAAWTGLLRIELLYVVSFVLGSTVVIFMVAYQSFVPTLVGRTDIAEANAALEATTSITAVAGPGIGGLLVQALTAPFALLLDALSYLISAALVASIRVVEPPPIPDAAGRPMLEQIREGLRVVRTTPVLFALVRGGTIHNFFGRMFDALFVLYAARNLGLDPATIGLVLAAAGPGSFVGSLVATRIPRRIGLGTTIWTAQLLTGVARLLVPLAGSGLLASGQLLSARPTISTLTLGLSMFLLGFARTLFNVNQLSLRQAITADRMHGRVNATMRFVMWGVTPIGALIGGLLASSAIGIQGTLFIAALGALAATIPFLLPAISGLGQMPEPLVDDAGVGTAAS